MGHFYFIIFFICALAFYGFVQTKLRKKINIKRKLMKQKW